jgi:hypothetical protein
VTSADGFVSACISVAHWSHRKTAPRWCAAPFHERMKFRLLAD